jgi:hypothetical protein
MSFWSRLRGGIPRADADAAQSDPPSGLAEDRKTAIQALLAELGDENNIEGRISAARQLASLPVSGDPDVPAALAAAGKKAAMQFEVKRMSIAMMHGVRPSQIDVKPHADDSRVAAAAVDTLRKIASRKGPTNDQAKAALRDLAASIKSDDVRARVGL